MIRGESVWRFIENGCISARKHARNSTVEGFISDDETGRKIGNSKLLAG